MRQSHIAFETVDADLQDIPLPLMPKAEAAAKEESQIDQSGPM
ncbi:hypothetical protein [Rhodopirellula bahusiensis]